MTADLLGKDAVDGDRGDNDSFTWAASPFNSTGASGMLAESESARPLFATVGDLTFVEASVLLDEKTVKGAINSIASFDIVVKLVVYHLTKISRDVN